MSNVHNHSRVVCRKCAAVLIQCSCANVSTTGVQLCAECHKNNSILGGMWEIVKAVSKWRDTLAEGGQLYHVAEAEQGVMAALLELEDL